MFKIKKIFKRITPTRPKHGKYRRESKFVVRNGIFVFSTILKSVTAVFYRNRIWHRRICPAHTDTKYTLSTAVDYGDQTDTGDCRRAVCPERPGTVDGFFPQGFIEVFRKAFVRSPPPRARRSLFSTCRRSAPVSRGRCKLYAGQPVILYFVINSRRGKFCFTHTRISYYLNAELMNGERSPQVRAVCCIQGGGSFGTLFKSSCVRVGGLIPPTTFCVSNARTGKWSSLVFETDAFKYVLIAL